MVDDWIDRGYEEGSTRPLTAKDEVSICTHCHTVSTGPGPCLNCTSPNNYARFYGKEELSWWIVQYMRNEDRDGAHYIRNALNILKRATKKGGKKNVRTP